MSNKTALKDNVKSEKIIPNTSVVKISPDKVAAKKQKKLSGKSSALVAASLGRSAVDHVRAHSRGDIRGSSGLANTGPFVSYERED